MSFRPDAADAADDLVRGDGYDGCVRSDGEVLQQGEKLAHRSSVGGSPEAAAGGQVCPMQRHCSGGEGRYSVPGGAAYAVTVESRQHGGILGDG